MGSRKVSVRSVAGALAKLSATDIFLCLAFAFVAVWALWFGISCIVLGAPFEGAIACVSAAVFVLCGIVLVRQRMSASESEKDVEWGPVSLEVSCMLRAGTDRGKRCTITCRSAGMVLDFDGSWSDFVPYDSIRVVGTLGRRSISLVIPGPKGDIEVRLSMTSSEDRDALMMNFVAMRVEGATIPEASRESVNSAETTDRLVSEASRRVSEGMVR